LEKITCEFRLLNYIKCNAFVIIQSNLYTFLISNIDFQHFLKVANKQTQGDYWGSRVHMGGINGANALASLIILGCLLCFANIGLHVFS